MTPVLRGAEEEQSSSGRAIYFTEGLVTDRTRPRLEGHARTDKQTNARNLLYWKHQDYAGQHPGRTDTDRQTDKTMHAICYRA